MLPHLSKGYQLTGPNGGVDSETAEREHETERGYKVPNGAIYTTVGDLAHFASFLIGQGPESVLKTASLEAFQMQSVVPADLGLTHGYGIGFEVDRRENYVAFGHGSGCGLYGVFTDEYEGWVWSDRVLEGSGESDQHRGTSSRSAVEVNARRQSGGCQDETETARGMGGKRRGAGKRRAEGFDNRWAS
jgi:hypothetical protein